MRKICWAILIIVASSSSLISQGRLARPKITGIDHADFYTTSAEANSHLYTVVLGLTSAKPVEQRQTQRFLVGRQFVGYSPAPDEHATNRLDHVAFATENCAQLQRYLTARGVKIQKTRGNF